MDHFEYQNKKDELRRFLKQEPLCGEDFCDSCGDCLACWPEGWSGCQPHSWVVYTDSLTNEQREKMAGELSAELGYPVKIGEETGAWRDDPPALQM